MKHIVTIIFFCSLLLSANAQETVDSLNHYIQNFQFKKALLLLDSQEETTSNRFQAAMCYKALGENKTAINILEQLSQDLPEDIKIKTELANCYERMSRWKDTSDTYANLMSIDTTNLYFSIKKSEAEINRKNYKQAITDLELVLQKDTLLNAVKLLGKTYETINNLDSAIYYYNMAWTADSLDSFSASNLVNTLLKKKEYEKALDYSIKSLELVPDDKSLNMLHGYSYYALEDYDSAASILEACFLSGDSSLIVNRSLGISFFHKGDSECSYEYLSRAYKQDTTNAVVLYHLAVTARETGHYPESINSHEKLLEKMIPSNMQLYLNYRGLAMAYEKNENYYKAVEQYKKALDYASTDQRMDILSPMASIYENKLSGKVYDKSTALNYYEQYKSALLGYVNFLKSQKEETSPQIIEEYELQLQNLNSHIVTLKKYITENTPPPLTDKDFLYVVNDTVVIQPPKENVISRRMISDFSKVKENKLLHWVEIAKKSNKRVIILFDVKQEQSEN